MPKFKKGDVLEVVDALGYIGKKKGDVFTLDEDSKLYRGLEYVHEWHIRRFKLVKAAEVAEEVEEQWTPKLGETVTISDPLCETLPKITRYFVAYSCEGNLITSVEKVSTLQTSVVFIWDSRHKAHRIEEPKPKKRIWSIRLQDWQYI